MERRGSTGVRRLPAIFHSPFKCDLGDSVEYSDVCDGEGSCLAE